MAIGAIEMATIARSQDYSSIKHSENTKVHVDQSNLGIQADRQLEQKTKQVNDSDNVDWHQQKQDAKEQGKNQYSGDGGQKRPQGKEPEGKVVLKGHGGFDIKI